MNNPQLMQAPTIGVYLGSKMGNNPSFQDAICSLGKGIALRGYTLVYGGGGTGLMGLLAEQVKSHGGTIIGITTEHLSDIEKPYAHLDELYVVQSMYERKRLIHEKSSRLLAMPGGLGTFDELFETWCALKIGTLKKPFGLVNVDGYFNPMLEFVAACSGYGFFKAQDLDILTVYDGVSTYLNSLEKEQQHHVCNLSSHFAVDALTV